MICEIVVPAGIDPPETVCPTTKPVVLVVEMVCEAVALSVTPKAAFTVPICASVVGAEVICQVPASNFVTAAADVVLLTIPRISFVLELVPPRKRVLPAVVPL